MGVVGWGKWNKQKGPEINLLVVEYTVSLAKYKFMTNRKTK